MVYEGKGLGALFQEPDPRDKLFGDYLNKHAQRILENLPPKVLLHPMSPRDGPDPFTPIYDQGQLGSCTANEAAGQYAYVLGKLGKPQVDLSRLQIYRSARVRLGLSVKRDTGATGRACAKVLAKYGACPETMWPYNIKKFAAKPANVCLQASGDHQLLQYLAIPANGTQTLDQLKASFAQGYPVGVSMTVYNNFFHPNAQGVVPYPAGGVAGGHRFLLTGYDDSRQVFQARNSWGKGWALDGYFFIRYDHVQHFGQDFWTFRDEE
jgi:C1A family cysteine protease